MLLEIYEALDKAERFVVVLGLADRIMWTLVSTTSVALGACLIEKFFTLSRLDKVPDSQFSIEPNELKQLCKDAKLAWQSLGEAGYERKKAEEETLIYRRSLYFTKDISAGETITKENIRSIRPGYGIPPKFLPKLLGKKVAINIIKGTPVSWELIQ